MHSVSIVFSLVLIRESIMENKDLLTLTGMLFILVFMCIL